MNKLEKKISELEARIAALESRPVQEVHTHYHYNPVHEYNPYNPHALPVTYCKNF